MIKICFVWQLPSYLALSHTSQSPFHFLQPDMLLLHSVPHEHPQLLHRLKNYLLWGTCRTGDNNSVWRAWMKFSIPLGISKASFTTSWAETQEMEDVHSQINDMGIFDFCTKTQLLPFIPAFAWRFKAKKSSASQLFSLRNEKPFPSNPEPSVTAAKLQQCQRFHDQQGWGDCPKITMRRIKRISPLSPTRYN